MERVEASVVGHCREEYDTDSDTTNSMSAGAMSEPLRLCCLYSGPAKGALSLSVLS
eukprot:m.748166 g.748166  ORF g.748166 m.748166 type:complete len:56 (+) comp23148_c0_seq26:3353-3520(+)